jgi:hypothetical protein
MRCGLADWLAVPQCPQTLLVESHHLYERQPGTHALAVPSDRSSGGDSGYGGDGRIGVVAHRTTIQA